MTSEIIDATDGRTTDDRRRTNFDFMLTPDGSSRAKKWSGDEVDSYLYTIFSVI